jgi:hypothetical protein
MTQTINARLTPWATQRISKRYCDGGKVTKQALRQSLRDYPKTEFWTMGNFDMRDGACFTTAEVAPASIEVRTIDNEGRNDLLAIVEVHPSGAVVVR